MCTTLLKISDLPLGWGWRGRGGFQKYCKYSSLNSDIYLKLCEGIRIPKTYNILNGICHATLGSGPRGGERKWRGCRMDFRAIKLKLLI